MVFGLSDLEGLPERRTREQWLQRLSFYLTKAHSHLMYESPMKDTIAVLLNELALHEARGTELSFLPKLERFLLTREVDFLDGPAKERLNDVWEKLRGFLEYSYTDEYAQEMASFLIHEALEKNESVAVQEESYFGGDAHG